MNTATSPELRRLLFIDDNPEHLALMRMRAEKNLAVIVDVATTSCGAEQLLNQHCYDVVICDVSLRGEDGLTICAKLLEYDPGQPLLLLTNYDALHTVVDQAAQLGVPLFPKMKMSDPEFLVVLQTLLTRRPCAEPLRRQTGRLTDSASSQGNSARNVTRRKPRISLTSPLLAEARRSAAA